MKSLSCFPTALSRQFASFALVLTGATALALSHSLAIGGGHIWRAHQRAGVLLLQGQIPEVPTYPMWGYSFLAAIFGTNLFFIEAAITLLVLLLWYYTLIKNEPQTKWSWVNGAAAALVLAPWAFLSVSYYSNSIGQTFLFLAAWFMFLAMRQSGGGHSFRNLLLSALFMGIAVNFRTEYMIFMGLLCFSLLIYGVFQGQLKETVLLVGVFVGIIFLMLIPWLIYTNTAVGRPIFTSTNGGAVRYHGLGVLPGNPWGIVSRDPFVSEIAERELNASPWSYQAHRYFGDRFIQAIADHPDAFVKRVFTGWHLLLMQGVYTPDLRLWAAQSPADDLLFDYAHEMTKQKLGLHVNHLELNKYQEQGIGVGDLQLRHYGILAAEYWLRFLFLTAFVVLVSLTVLALWQKSLDPILVVLCGSAVVYLLLLSGVVQANPRHTTLVIPILATAVLTAKPITSHFPGVNALRHLVQSFPLQAPRTSAPSNFEESR